MVFLYGDDNPRKVFPKVHFSLMAIWIVVFFVTHYALGNYVPGLSVASFQEHVEYYGLIPYDLHYLLHWSLLTTLFLHISGLSLFLNLFFLWIVGDNVESELGHLGYLLAFLGFTSFGYLCHFFLVYSTNYSLSYVVGPSAGIAGILGMYLYFFPKAQLKAYLLKFPFRFEKISLHRVWSIFYWISIPLLVYFYQYFQPEMLNEDGFPLVVNVHFGVHCGFVLLGIFVAIPVNWIRGKPPEPDAPLFAKADLFGDHEKKLLQKLDKVQGQTSLITELLYTDPAKAREEYLKFSLQNPDFILEPEPQLECAYSFLDNGELAQAQVMLEAYEKNYPQGPYSGEVRLLLGELYSKNPFLLEEAKEHIEFAKPRLEDASMRARAEKVLEHIQQYYDKDQDTPLRDNEPCYLMSQNVKAVKTEKLGDILACFQDIPRPEVLRFFSATKGILAKNIKADRALLAAQLIQKEAKLPVLVVPESQMVVLPEMQNLRQIDILRDGLRLYPEKSEVTFRSFDDIHLISIVKRTDLKASGDSGNKTKLVVDCFAFNPWVHFQMVDGIFCSSTADAGTSISEDGTRQEILPKKFAQLLKKYGKKTTYNFGVAILADRGDWERVTFDSEENHLLYCRWLLQLQNSIKQSPLALVKK